LLMFDCITVGAAIRDVFLKSKEFKSRRDPKSKNLTDLVLPLGSKINVDEMVFETGGGATNAAVTFTRQGLRTACICRIGSDPGGKAIEDFLHSEGVDTRLVIKDREHYTGYSIILTAESGERTILVYRGASAHFNEEFVPKSKLDAKWLFISSLGGDVSLLKDLVNWAEKHGIKTAIVPGNKELEKGAKVLSSVFSKADVLIMNKEEASTLTGIPAGKKEKVVHKMCLITKGIGVITDASNGATACDRTHLYHIGTHSNKAVERTGAGDAFASGFVAGLAKYESIEGALELATDNASSVVNWVGAKKGILHANQEPFKEKLKVTKSKM